MAMVPTTAPKMVQSRFGCVTTMTAVAIQMLAMATVLDHEKRETGRFVHCAHFESFFSF